MISARQKPKFKMLNMKNDSFVIKSEHRLLKKSSNLVFFSQEGQKKAFIPLLFFLKEHRGVND